MDLTADFLMAKLCLAPTFVSNLAFRFKSLDFMVDGFDKLHLFDSYW
jgi:hypothetical protein